MELIVCHILKVYYTVIHIKGKADIYSPFDKIK